jgi:YVTN family beta-propeller protein
MVAYIGNSAEADVTVINTATNDVATTVPVGGATQWVAVAPDGDHVYVTSPDGNAVYVIEVFTNSVTAISVGGVPAGVAVSDDGAHAYVADNANGAVLVIATATNQRVATIPGLNTPWGVAVAPTRGLVYVTDSGPEGEDSIVWVIDTGPNTLAMVQGTFFNPRGVAARPDGAYVYVTNNLEGTVSVIDTSMNTVVGDLKVGADPLAIAVSADGTRGYVTSKGDPEPSMTVINTVTNTIAGSPVSLDTGFVPSGVSVMPDGAHVYVVGSGANSVWVIDTVTRQVVKKITSVGNKPFALGQFLAFPCAVQNLFNDDARAVEQMQRVRDEQLSAPAGAFLSEVLTRHSADLVGLLTDHPELRDESRDLLLEATRVAQEGAQFDDELIDRAERLVSRSEVLVPSSMSGIPGATRTILASLRERTLAAGIAEASETIAPQFPPSRLPPSQP